MSFILPVKAENWVNVANDTDGNANYVDSDSILAHKTIEGRFVYWTMRASPSGYKKAEEVTNCRNRTAGLLKLVSYTKSWHLIDSMRIDDVRMNSVVPGSVGEGIHDYVCQ
ncbi:surface-adhesin E family protein [Brunnivagina elsteri]|uniref:surface-adhesin E family protein n=1 Tax=Brunnivagina elsteri TaxID=1247191 RepID=UPI001178675A|nr:surface-adhesin E family protein [Calothrix elsteri]